jgi:kumamolisin
VGGRHIPRAIVLAAVVAAAAAAPTASASATGHAPRVVLRGTVSPAVAKGIAHVVGTPSASTRVTAVVAFKPRNPALLHYVAMHSTGHGMSNAQIRQLFLPTASTVAHVRSFLAANGLSVVDATDMSLVVSGTAASAERAFGVGLRNYKTATGPAYRAPAGNVRLPSGIASVVQSVSGLDTSLKMHPHYKIVKHAQRGGGGGTPPGPVPQDAPDTPCAAATTAQTNLGTGYLPAELAGYYGHEADANHEGSGQTIGFVEFSNYRQNDDLTFRNCFTAPAITGTLQPDITIGSGPTDSSGQVEVNLDIEVAMGAARDASYQVYKAANNLALGPTMFNKMRQDNVDVVSDSWGLCELLVPPKLTLTENTSLELLAAGGSSLYVASGDDGSADCKAASPNFRFLAIDDPSSQPFATAVGGTNLDIGGGTEKAWKGSGGGVSYNWPRPAYQKAVTSVRDASIPGSFCAGGTLKCRVTPDVAMDAAPGRGYLIFSHGLGGSGGSWNVVGGTSAAAPLMAGITADANESVGGGASDLGFANPFIYGTIANGMIAADFRDITSGNNSNGTGSLWPALVEYDMVTGRGSVRGANFATELASYVAPAIVFDTTKLTATHPLNLKRVKKGSKVTFSGVLTDTTGHHPLFHRQVLLLAANGNVIGFDGTNKNGVWQIVLKVSKRLTWHAIFMGSAHEKGSTSPSRTVRIK